MSNDAEHDGNVDDSNAGQQGEAEEVEEGIQGPYDELRTDQTVNDEEDLPGKIVTHLEASVTRSYSGPLPPAEQFNAYPIEAQRVILDVLNRETKAIIDDESLRQDRLTEAEITQGKMGLVFSFIIIIAAIAAAVLCVSFGASNIALLLIALPFATIISNLFKPASRNKDEKQATSKKS